FPAAFDAVIRIEHAHHPRYARLGGPAPRVAGEGDAARRRPVIGAVTRHDLVTAGEKTCELDRVLVGFGAAVGEEERVNVAGTNLGQLRAQPRARLVRHERIRVAERLRLFFDGADDALIAVADVHRHQLAVEVDEAFALGRPEIDSLRPGDRDRINFRLR